MPLRRMIASAIARPVRPFAAFTSDICWKVCWTFHCAQRAKIIAGKSRIIVGSKNRKGMGVLPSIVDSRRHPAGEVDQHRVFEPKIRWHPAVGVVKRGSDATGPAYRNGLRAGWAPGFEAGEGSSTLDRR